MDPHNTIVLIMGRPIKGTPNAGKPLNLAERGELMARSGLYACEWCVFSRIGPSKTVLFI